MNVPMKFTNAIEFDFNLVCLVLVFHKVKLSENRAIVSIN